VVETAEIKALKQHAEKGDCGYLHAIGALGHVSSSI